MRTPLVVCFLGLAIVKIAGQLSGNTPELSNLLQYDEFDPSGIIRRFSNSSTPPLDVERPMVASSIRFPPIIIIVPGPGSGGETNPIPTRIAPSISKQPVSQTVKVGDQVTFDITVSGNPTPTIQWFFSRAGQSTWDQISTTEDLTITSVHATDAGDYYFRAENAAGSKTSDTATLTVTKLAQSIDFAELPDRTFGDPPFTITVTSSSSTPPVSLEVLGPARFLDHNVLELTGTGVVSIVASQAGHDDYDPAPPITHSFTVTPPTIFGSSFDFDGNGRRDLVLQEADGSVAVWLVDGPTNIRGKLFEPGPDWRVVGAGDFDFDGKSDLVWQHNDGTVGFWLMNGFSLTQTAAIFPGTGWRVVGIGDLDGDSRSDLILQHHDGSIQLWIMNGTTRAESAMYNPGSSWHFHGLGDADGDGKSDLLFQNDDGSIALWLMDGVEIRSGGILSAAGLKVVGFGDVNGDGRDDLVLEDSRGTVALWLMNGLAVTKINVYSPGVGWHVVGLANMTSDARREKDIVLHHDDGSAAIWIMIDGTIANGYSSEIGTTTRFAGTGNLDVNSMKDMIFQDDNGRVAFWILDGGRINKVIEYAPGNTWHVLRSN